MITQGLKKTKYSDYAEWNDIFEGRINADLVISGSSRAWVQISPKIVEDQTNCSAYNLGMNGHNLYLQHNRYRNYIEYNREPKFLIQTLGNTTLSKRKDLYNYQQFLPYLGKETITEAVYTYEGLNKWDKFLPFHRYIGEYRIIKVGLFEFLGIKKFSNGKYKGYKGNDAKWNGEEFEKLKKSNKRLRVKIDRRSVRIFEAFLKYCKDKNIKLFLVYPPHYIGGQAITENHQEIMGLYKNLASEYDTPFLDYSNHKLSADKKNFYNVGHLTRSGAELFTEILIEDLLRLGLSPCEVRSE